ncbi:thermonuclease family protein [uncultured Algimonas sp.]|uniref:thermonuclease family protein n=1 Tax=uncultured Algimonas sp. TaxID=1547920 RepID=UPI00261440FB|nr:thermonuclease family protein [uncultured Algimonas sp.]
MRRPVHITRRAGIIGGGALALSLAGAMRASDLTAGETGRVAAVTSGQTFTLDSGLRVKLAGIAAPRRAQSWGREAHEGLAGLLRGRRVRLSYGGDSRDRYDRALAQVHTLSADGSEDLWVQAELVRLGLARVYTWPDEYIDHAPLYRIETEARARDRGLWSDASYGVRDPEPNALAQHVDSLQLVEGIVTSTADVRGRAYLNFGADYRTDFTVAVAKKHRKRFTAYDPVSLEGARVRVRGWVELINGPMIWASHPARIEVLS